MTDTIAFQILFKMNDADSAENVSKQIGKYTREARSHSTKDGAIAFGGTSSYSLEGTELITAQDILNIPNDEIIILVSGHKAKPIKIKAAYYFKEKDSLRKLNWKFDPTNGKPIEKENKQTQIIDMKERAIESQPTLPNPQAIQNTQEPQITEQEAIKQAQEEQALYEYEKTLQEQEALKDKSQEDLQKEMQSLLEKQRKEYVYKIEDKDINAVLQAPLKKDSYIPKETFINIQKETYTLRENGYKIQITDELIRERIQRIENDKAE